MKKIGFFALVSLMVFANVASKKQSVGTNIGDVAPNIVQAGINDKNLSLNALQGNIVLIDFWASWCGPCRKANPQLVNTYQKYKDKKFKNAKGFTVFSVSLDSKKADWIKAIKDDGLEWTNHVSDLKYWQNAAAQLYKVRSIPYTVLIDENGVIVGKELNPQQLEYELSKRLAN